MSKKPDYADTIEYRLNGLPCKIGVGHYFVQPPFNGSAFYCDSRDDYYGYSECEWEILDRKGYSAPWLDRKLTDADRADIEECIEAYYKEMAEDYY